MVIGTAGTTTAFLATLYVAQRNYLRSREHIPHLTMTLSLERVAVRRKRDVIMASLEAENTGSGLCTVREINWMAVAVSPCDDETVGQMEEGFRTDTDQAHGEELAWHGITQRPVRVDMRMEPGETGQLTQEFAIGAEARDAITSAYVSGRSTSELADGWRRRTIHIRARE